MPYLRGAAPELLAVFLARFTGTCKRCGAELRAEHHYITWSKRGTGMIYCAPSCEDRWTADDHPPVGAPGSRARVPAPTAGPKAAPVPTTTPDDDDDSEPSRAGRPDAAPDHAPAAPASLEETIAARVAPLVQARVADALRDAGATREQIARAVADALAEAGVSSEQIQRAIAVALAEATPPPVRVEIVTRDGEPRTVPGLVHKQLPELLDVLNAGLWPYLHGSPGCGKTHAVLQAFALPELDLPRLSVLSLSQFTPESRLYGHPTVYGELVDADFALCYRDGGGLLLDEVDLANPALLASLNCAIENGKCSFPVLGTRDMHARFVLAVAGNTAGMGGDAHYAERRALDPAFRSRFQYIAWQLDEALEAAVVAAEGAEAGTAWLAWLRDVREIAVDRAPRLVCGMREAKAGARLLARTAWSAERVATAALWKGLDADTVRGLTDAVPMPELR